MAIACPDFHETLYRPMLADGGYFFTLFLNFMKSPKRIAVVLVTGFLAFAPPGTMIFGLMLILGIVGNRWLVVGGILGLAVVGGAGWLVLRRRAGKRADARKDRCEHLTGVTVGNADTEQHVTARNLP